MSEFFKVCNVGFPFVLIVQKSLKNPHLPPKQFVPRPLVYPPPPLGTPPQHSPLDWKTREARWMPPPPLLSTQHPLQTREFYLLLTVQWMVQQKGSYLMNVMIMHHCLDAVSCLWFIKWPTFHGQHTKNLNEWRSIYVEV